MLNPELLFSWIFNASIRDNILFGKPFDDERYGKVLHATSLNRDIEIFPHGDRTLVGERGASLSGGQRARVSLARYERNHEEILFSFTFYSSQSHLP